MLTYDRFCQWYWERNPESLGDPHSLWTQLAYELIAAGRVDSRVDMRGPPPNLLRLPIYMQNHDGRAGDSQLTLVHESLEKGSPWGATLATGQGERERKSGSRHTRPATAGKFNQGEGEGAGVHPYRAPRCRGDHRRESAPYTQQ